MRLLENPWLAERGGGIPAWRRLLWLLVVSALAVVLGFLTFPAEQAGRLVKYGGYHALALIFAWWVWAAVELWRSSAARRSEWWRARLTRETAQAAVLIAVLVLVACLTVPRVYNVMFDEPVIQSTAWNLHMEREVGALNRAHEIGGLLRSLDTYLDKRPYFFPFLVSLLHDLTGYREANAFWLNTALMPVVLGLAYWLGRRLSGHGAGLAAVAGLGAFSLLALNSGGAGLEMLNLALLLGLMAAGVLYLETPDEPRLAFMVLTSILLANTRYESAIYVGCAALVVFEGWRRARRFVLPVTAILAPLLLVPYALHNRYLAGTPRLWELRAGNTSRFGMGYLEENLGYAWTYFFNTSPQIANSLWLTIGGAVASVVLGAWAWRAKPGWTRWRPVSAALVLVALGVAGNLCLLMAYYWGDLSDPVVSRLSLPLHAVLALVIAAAVGCLPERRRRPVAIWCVVLACVSYVAFGLRVNENLHRSNAIEVSQRWEFEVLARRGPARRLVITDKSPLSWFAVGVPSIMPGRLIMKPEALPYHLRHHTFDEVLVMQTLYPAPDGSGRFLINAEHALPKGYVLEQIAERRVASKLQRICVLKEIKVDEPPPPTLPERT